jgi:hypothetical protein
MTKEQSCLNSGHLDLSFHFSGHFANICISEVLSIVCLILRIQHFYYFIWKRQTQVSCEIISKSYIKNINYIGRSSGKTQSYSVRLRFEVQILGDYLYFTTPVIT